MRYILTGLAHTASRRDGVGALFGVGQSYGARVAEGPQWAYAPLERLFTLAHSSVSSRKIGLAAGRELQPHGPAVAVRKKRAQQKPRERARALGDGLQCAPKTASGNTALAIARAR